MQQNIYIYRLTFTAYVSERVLELLPFGPDPGYNI